MASIREHDHVVLTEDRLAERLTAGDVGTVVHVHPDAAACEGEFFSANGETVAVVTLERSKVRAAQSDEATHAGRVA